MTAPIPNVAFQFPEDGLGLAPAAPSGIFAVFGASSSGTVNVPQDVAGTPANVIARWGYGPGPSLVGNLVQSGATAVFTRVDSTPVAAGAVTKTGSSASTMTVTGDPLDRYNVIVTVVRAGTAGSDPEPGFTVSLDGGRTVSREIRMPANRTYAGLVATTGMTLNFTAAAMDVGTTYEFDTSAPTVAASDVVDAIDALRQSTQAFSMIYVCGAFDKDDTATIVDAVATMIPKKRFCRVFTESRDSDTGESELDWMDDLEADFAGFESSLSIVSAGYIGVRDILTGAVLWRSIGHLAAIRAAGVQVSRDLAFVGDGPLRPYKNASASDWTPAPGKFVHNEDTVPGLNSNRFMTIRSFVGLNGAYVTNPNMMAGPTSDYDLLQFGRIADAVAFNTNNFFTQQLSRDVLLNPTNGRILEKEAKSLEQGNDSANQELLANQDVSSLQTIVSRADNILTTRTLTVTVKIVPKGYLKTIDVTITFVPSIAAAA